MDSIICMAGSAKRLGLKENKVYLELNGKMVFLYSLEKLMKISDKVILTIREEDLDYIKPYLSDKIDYVIGGSERYHSVYNAMLKTTSKKVLIHDGARPNLSNQVIDEILNNLNDYDLLFPYQKIKGTTYLKKNLKLIDRESLIVASTPQVVDRELFIDSYKKAIKHNFIPTDDISLVLKYHKHLKVYPFLDSDNNIKITTKEDLDYMKYLMERGMYD